MNGAEVSTPKNQQRKGCRESIQWDRKALDLTRQDDGAKPERESSLSYLSDALVPNRPRESTWDDRGLDERQ